MPHTISSIEQIIEDYRKLIDPNFIPTPLFTFEIPPLSVEISKVPNIRNIGDVPKLCISIGDGNFEPATAEDDFAYYGFYNVTFTMIYASGQKLKQRYEVVTDRVALKKLILDFGPKLASGAITGTLDDVNEIRRPVYDPKKLDQGFDYSALSFEFKTRESR
jgi:hypothetical protein